MAVRDIISNIPLHKSTSDNGTSMSVERGGAKGDGGARTSRTRNLPPFWRTETTCCALQLCIHQDDQKSELSLMVKAVGFSCGTRWSKTRLNAGHGHT